MRARTGQPRRPTSGWAFAPGHLTGLFSPELGARDPRARGSIGAGIVLELGVHAAATWRPAPRATVSIRHRGGGALPISEEVAARLLARRPGRLTVDLHHELPIGQGFGMSAAGAVATGLAVGRLVGAPPTKVWEVAHLADLTGGGGLGGVSAIGGGGWERRLTPGVPPWGRVVHRPFPGTVLVAVVGRAIPSPDLLTDARRLASFRRAAGAGLTALSARPSRDRLLAESERFTDAVGLASPRAARAIAQLRASGAWSGQAMFGQSLWAVPRTDADRPQVLRTLVDLRLPAVELRAARAGAGVRTGAAGQSLLNRARLGRLP